MSPQKSMVLITGLPESGWTESDILQLVQTFGTPSDVITATQIGKVGVTSVPSEAETQLGAINMRIQSSCSRE